MVPNKKDKTQIAIKYNKILSSKGYGLLKEKFSPSELQRARRETTVKPFIPADYSIVEEFPIYRESSNYLYLPKFYGISRFGPPDKIIIGEGEEINLSFKGKIRANQKEPIEEAQKQLMACGGGVLCLPCGFGKTVLAINLICWLKRKTLVIVNKEFLLNQWKERINEFSDAKIGILQKGRVEIEGNDIVIGMLHSISMKDYPKGTFDSFGTVIVDEVHHIAARVFSKSLLKVNTKFMIGLSATPERKDGLSKVFEWFMGDVFCTIKRKNHDVIVNRILLNYKDPEYSKEVLNFRGKSNLPAMINNIVAYQKRNEFIVEIIKLLSTSNRRVLLLSDRRGHLEEIKKMIDSESICSSGFYVGGMKQKSLKESEEKDLILGTFMMAAEAMDIPSLDTLILSTPKGDIEQAVGRILRKCKEDTFPVVIDVIDTFSVFYNQSIKRNRFYKKNNYFINTNEMMEGYDISNLIKMERDKQSGLETLIQKVPKQQKHDKNGGGVIESKGVCLID